MLLARNDCTSIAPSPARSRFEPACEVEDEAERSPPNSPISLDPEIGGLSDGGSAAGPRRREVGRFELEEGELDEEENRNDARLPADRNIPQELTVNYLSLEGS